MRAVLFDMDGVLVMSNPLHLQAWQEFGPRVGLNITEEMFYREFSGRKNEEALEALFPGRFTAAERLELSRRKEALFRERYVPRLSPVPGACELVHDLQRQGVPLALATSGPPENARAILRHLGLDEAFAVVVTGGEVQRAKPDPEIFQRAATGLGVRPDQTVVVEDSCAGVKAAVAAGAVCLAVSTSEPPERLELAGAARVVPDLRAVNAAVLARLFRQVRGPMPPGSPGA